jgi:hypothetical protein|tara:strand:+ start:644 stop:901 length:258 start_codon:yes stop_codon:yes gene_type:complete
MNLKTLDIVRNELLQQKIKAEANIEHILMDKEIYPENRVPKIIEELGKLKDSTLKINFWEEFINNNIIIPENRETLKNNDNEQNN